MKAQPKSPLLEFHSRVDVNTGEGLAHWFHQVWPAYQRWSALRKTPLSAAASRDMLQKHMPELVATYDTLCHTLGADEEVASFLALYNPPSFRAACSQVIWRREPLQLIRNYDFPAHLSDRQLLHSSWNGTRVIAMTDCLWGVLDGMNEHGLAVSLAYGGRENRGDGFAITLVLRYILEFCSTSAEAVSVLQRVPVHMPYNVSLLDASGDTRTVVICPGEPVQVNRLPFATNHQPDALRDQLETTADSVLRESFLSTRLADPVQTDDGLLQMFMQPPLLRRASNWKGWGTLYTARYDIRAGTAELHWPDGNRIQQSFAQPVEASLKVTSPGFN